MGGDFGDGEVGLGDDGGDNIVDGGVDEAHAAVGGEEAEGLDVEDLGDGAIAVIVPVVVLLTRTAADKVGLEAADHAANDLGLSAVVGPGDDARGEAFDGAAVEAIRVVDGQEERVDAAEGVDIVAGDGANVGFAG